MLKLFISSLKPQCVPPKKRYEAGFGPQASVFNTAGVVADVTQKGGGPAWGAPHAPCISAGLRQASNPDALGTRDTERTRAMLPARDLTG